MKLNDTHQLLVYADDVNIVGGRVHAAQRNKEAFLVASKYTALKVNATKTKYMFHVSRSACRTKSQYKD